MESFSQPPILPSNAPPWLDPDRDSLVLQEQRGNRHLGGYVQSQLLPVDDVSDDSALASTCGQTRPFQGLQPTTHSFGHPGLAITRNKYDRKGYRAFNSLHQRSYHGLDTEGLKQREKDVEAELQARHLFAMFSRCDGYIKYRNRQPKERKGKEQDVKWPDHIEDAFLRALCRHPPCGRKKEPPPGSGDGAKAMGRNELIADYIFRHTGEERTRKQVSSHIQVLKPFVLSEPMIMRYLATPNEKKQTARQRELRKQSSMYNPNLRLRAEVVDQRHNYVLQSSLNLQPEEFHMYMRPHKAEHTDSNGSKTLHTYSITDKSYPSKYLVRGRTEFYTRFPELSTLPIDRFVYGNFLAFQVPIALHPRKLFGTKDLELAISYVFKAVARSPPISISSRTRLYMNGKPFTYNKDGTSQPDENAPWDQCDAEAIEYEEDVEAKKQDSDADESLEMDDIDESRMMEDVDRDTTKMVKYYMPLSSKFWALYLWRTASLEYAVNELETLPLRPNESEESRAATISEKRRQISDSLSSLTAVQEITAVQGNGQPQVVLTVYFSFCHAANESAAITSWQQLDLTSVFTDAIPMSAGGLSTATSASKEGHPTQADAYCKDIKTYNGFDYSTLMAANVYREPNSVATHLASPIPLNDAAHQTPFNTNSWLENQLLPITDLSASTIDTLLPKGQSTDANDYDFNSGHITIALDESNLQATAPASFGPSVSAFDNLALPTDPLLLQPSQNAAPWLSVSGATDYAALFSQPHSPLYPDFGGQSRDPLADIAGALPDGFDAAAFQSGAHQAFAGASASVGEGTSSHQSRQHSFSNGMEPSLGLEESCGHDGSFALPNQSGSPHQEFGFNHGFTRTDSFAHSQATESFGQSQPETFALPTHTPHIEAFALPTQDEFINTQPTDPFVTSQATESFHSIHDSFEPSQQESFSHSQDPFATSIEIDSFDIGHIGHEHGSTTHPQEHDRVHQDCPRCVSLPYCVCVAGGAGF